MDIGGDRGGLALGVEIGGDRGGLALGEPVVQLGSIVDCATFGRYTMLVGGEETDDDIDDVGDAGALDPGIGMGTLCTSEVRAGVCGRAGRGAACLKRLKQYCHISLMVSSGIGFCR